MFASDSPTYLLSTSVADKERIKIGGREREEGTQRERERVREREREREREKASEWKSN